MGYFNLNEKETELLYKISSMEKGPESNKYFYQVSYWFNGEIHREFIILSQPIEPMQLLIVKKNIQKKFKTKEVELRGIIRID